MKEFVIREFPEWISPTERNLNLSILAQGMTNKLSILAKEFHQHDRLLFDHFITINPRVKLSGKRLTDNQLHHAFKIFLIRSLMKGNHSNQIFFSRLEGLGESYNSPEEHIHILIGSGSKKKHFGGLEKAMADYLNKITHIDYGPLAHINAQEWSVRVKKIDTYNNQVGRINYATKVENDTLESSNSDWISHTEPIKGFTGYEDFQFTCSLGLTELIGSDNPEIRESLLAGSDSLR